MSDPDGVLKYLLGDWPVRQKIEVDRWVAELSRQPPYGLAVR